MSQIAKENGEACAYPVEVERYEPQFGLTKREAFAMAALQGLRANAAPVTRRPWWNFFSEAFNAPPSANLAKVAVEDADALLAELSKETPDDRSHR